MTFVANPDGIWYRPYHPTDLPEDSYHRVLIEYDKQGINAPLFAISSALQREPLMNIIHTYFYRAKNYITIALNGAIANGTATTFTLDQNGADSTNGLVPGMQFLNFATREIVRVTSVTSGTVVEMVRGVGSVAGAAMLDDAVLVFIGSNYPQQSDRPDPQGFPASQATTYTSIVRNAWAVNDTEAQLARRAGWDTVARSKQDCFFQHAVGLEMTLLFSQGVAPLGNTPDQTGTVGVQESIRTRGDALNYVTLGATTSYADLRTAFEYAFSTTANYTNPMNRVLFVDNLAMAVVDDIGMNFSAYSTDNLNTDAFGMTFKEIRAFFGTVMVKHHQLFEAMIAPAYPGYAMLLDLPSIRYGYIPNREQVYEEFRGIRDSHSNGVDGQGGGYTSEIACVDMNPKGHAEIDGWTAAAA